MLPFQLAEAIRRATRGRRARVPAAGERRPLLRLLAQEVVHGARAAALSPAAVVGVAGAVSAVGILVALGPGYPGPVAPTAARWVVAGVVVAASVGLAHAMPRRWSDLREAARAARTGVLLVGAMALVTLVKVGLHESTPGPVAPAAARWGALGVLTTSTVVLVRRRARRTARR